MLICWNFDLANNLALERICDLWWLLECVSTSGRGLLMSSLTFPGLNELVTEPSVSAQSMTDSTSLSKTRSACFLACPSVIDVAGSGSL